MSDLQSEITQLKLGIQKLPANGEWWKKDARKTFEQTAIKLFYRGFSVSETIEILRELYQAMQHEY